MSMSKQALSWVGKKGVLGGLIVPKAHLVDAVRDNVILKQQAALQSLRG
jgi:hypothetical protein